MLLKLCKTKTKIFSNSFVLDNVYMSISLIKTQSLLLETIGRKRSLFTLSPSFNYELSPFNLTRKRTCQIQLLVRVFRKLCLDFAQQVSQFPCGGLRQIFVQLFELFRFQKVETFINIICSTWSTTTTTPLSLSCFKIHISVSFVRLFMTCFSLNGTCVLQGGWLFRSLVFIDDFLRRRMLAGIIKHFDIDIRTLFGWYYRSALMICVVLSHSINTQDYFVPLKLFN